MSGIGSVLTEIEWSCVAVLRDRIIK